MGHGLITVMNSILTLLALIRDRFQRIYQKIPEKENLNDPSPSDTGNSSDEVSEMSSECE